MKICYFNMDFPPTVGGMSAVASSLANWSVKQPEIERVVVVSFYNTEPRQAKEGKLEIFAYSSQTMLAMIFIALKRLWAFRDVDVIHATNIFPIGAIVVLLGKYVFGKKVYISVYGTDVLAVTPWAITKSVKKWAMQNCDRVIVCSQSTKTQVAKAYELSPSKMDVVYVGMSDEILTVTPKNIRDEYELTADDFVVLTVGRLVKRKGVDDLIRAIKEADDEAIKLMVVGEGEEKENLKRLAETLGVDGQVIFTGRVESVADFYHSANVFSMPSKFLEAEGDIEGLGIVYLEAQYFGLPVIGTRSGGIPEALDEGNTGFLVDEGDVKSLAERILDLKNNPQEYERMSGVCKKFVQDKFGWENIIKQIIELYKK